MYVRWVVRALALVVVLPAALSACSEEDRAPSPGAAQRQVAADEAAASFVAFAQGRGTEVPWADVVRYYLHGEQVAEFAPSFAADPATWDGCHPGDATYEGRDCPVSPLDAIAGGGDRAEPVVEDTAPTTVGCSADLPQPEVDATPMAWVRPAADERDCFSDYAVTLYLDDQQRVSAVDLVLSGP